MTPAPRFAFVEDALERADHLRDQDEALRTLWRNGRVLRVDAEGRTCVDAQGGLDAPIGMTLGEWPADAVFLGLRGDEAWFALDIGDAASGPESAPFETRLPRDGRIDLRSAAAHWPAFDATAFAQARAVLHWRRRHRFCGLDHYPRTDPAVIVAVTDGERLLLGRQASWPARRYSTLAGFVEPGETLEQTVAREVMEESGVRVRASRYLGSQPWPFPSSLMLGFVADAEPDPPQAADELEDARWFTRDEVGAALRGETKDDGLLLSPSVSISRWLIEAWHAGAMVAE